MTQNPGVNLRFYFFIIGKEAAFSFSGDVGRISLRKKSAGGTITSVNLMQDHSLQGHSFFTYLAFIFWIYKFKFCIMIACLLPKKLLAKILRERCSIER